MTTAGARDPGPIPLPVGSRVLHVGPSKTGTTSVQAAMWAARESMRRQGVRYAGRMRHSEEAARAAAGLGSPLSNSGAAAPKRRWDEIVAEIRRAPEARVVFSSELLAHAHRDAIRRIADDLDPGRVQVVVTLRPLARILASQWQQNVQTGQTASYEAWLHELFDPRAEGERQAGWWHRHRHDRLVARWAGVVGPERTTVVVVDDRDHGQVLRAFEGLLTLRAGTLELQHDLANRSLTLAEAEAMRAFNEAWNANRLGRADHTHLVIQGFALHMKARQPATNEARIETPQWALDGAAAVSDAVVRNLSTSGVRIIGDLARLTDAPASRRVGDAAPDPAIPPEVAASMAIGVLLMGGFAQAPATDGTAARSEAVARITSRRIGGVIYRRVRDAADQRVRSARDRVAHQGRRG